MSGVLHSIGKVFSKVWDFIRPVAEIVVAAAAVYFTAGLALSAFPATAGFAAALPGFAAGGTIGGGIGAGAVAGAGVFSDLASTIGVGGGLTAGAAADASAAVATDAAAAGALSSTAAEAGGAAAATADLPAAAVAGAADTGAAAAPSLAGGLSSADITSSIAANYVAPTFATGDSLLAGLGKMGLADKLLLASTATNTISGLTAPSPKDVQAAKNGFYGSFYGTNADGSGGGAVTTPKITPNDPSTGAPAAPSSATASPQMLIPQVNIAGQAQPGSAAPATANANSTQQSALQANLIPSIPYSGQPLAGTAPDFAVQGSTPLVQPKLI
jgi:hypothetical protein